jgi:membrane protease YdiL (CAAX protease family)
LDNNLGGVVLTLALIALIPLALFAYGRVVLRLRAEGGRVQAQGFVMADLMVALVLAGYFALLVVGNWPARNAEPAPIKIEQVLPGQLMLLIVGFGVAGFLVYRGADLIAMLGLKRVPPLRAASLSLRFLLGAVPIIWLTNFLTVYELKQGADEQQLVSLFREEVHRGHYSGVLTIVISGVLLAPCVEEFLFRGFFYGVFKRHLGAVAGAVASAGLFAAFHMNLASLPSLFVLALCLTIAYERSGSLLVPAGMHALFNLANLALLFFQARGLPS